jgi:LacI family transcriptional regulator
VASINDVARLAGVSPTTVSKVINNYKDVSNKTRLKVQKIIQEINFSPNVMARGLVKGRSWTVGILSTPSFQNPFLYSAMTGMKKALENTGYDLIYLTQENKQPNYNFANHCLGRNVEGVIAFGLEKDSKHLIDLMHSEIPALLIDINLVGKRTAYITSDNKTGVYQAVQHLNNMGHTKIGYLSPKPANYITSIRHDGFKEALDKCSLPYCNDYVLFTDDLSYSRQSGYELMKRLIEMPQLPTAVLCASDTLAIGAYEAMEEHGLKIPEDIAIVGFDDLDLCDLIRPKLTSVRQNIEAIGEKAIETLVYMIEDPSYSPKEIIMPTELVVRNSCGAQAR